MIWIIKDLNFGYKYSDKKYRTDIVKNSEKFIKSLNDKGNKGDIVIICGGLFSNTHPNLIAINDAKNFLSQIQCTIFLIDTANDVKKHDNKSFSVNKIFDYNVISEPTWVDCIYVVPNGFEKDTDTNFNIHNGLFNGVTIPSFYCDKKSGLIAFNPSTKMMKVLENKGIKQRIELKISSIEDLRGVNIPDMQNFIVDVLINDSLLKHYKDECDMFLFKLQPISVNQYSNGEITVDTACTDVDIAIKNAIKSESLLIQFNRIQEIYNKSI